MISQVFAIVAPIFICAALGYGWCRLGYDYPAGFISRLVTYIGAPCLIFHSLVSHPLPLDAMAQTALIAISILLVTLLFWTFLLRAWKLDVATYMPPLLFPNSGNMGLPLSLFAFGETGMTLGLGYMLLMMIAHLSLGLAIVQGGGSSPRTILKNLGAQPMIYAMAAGLGISAAGWQVPLWMGNTLGLLADFTIPLMLLTLGASLATLKIGLWQRALVLSAMRLVIALGITWLLCRWLQVEPLVQGVAMLYAAMPAAVFNYLFAFQYQRNPEEVAGIVVVSTLLSVAVLPVLLGLII